MKKASYLLIGIILFTFNVDLKAQSNDTINTFITEINNYLLDANKDMVDLRLKASITGRKVKMWGKFDNKSKIFTHKINFNSDGVKKERIVIMYARDGKNIIFKLLIVNDKICYAKKVKFNSSFQVVTKEEIVDEKIYNKVDYTEKPVKWIYIWNLKKQ